MNTLILFCRINSYKVMKTGRKENVFASRNRAQ